MARTARGSRASAPRPYTVSVGKATSPPRRRSAAASSRSAGDRALSSRVSTSRDAFEGRMVDALSDDLRDRAAPRLLEIGQPRIQGPVDDQGVAPHLSDLLERRTRRLADRLDRVAIGGRIGDDDAGSVLAEEQGVRPDLRAQRQAAAQVL